MPFGFESELPGLEMGAGGAKRYNIPILEKELTKANNALEKEQQKTNPDSKIISDLNRNIATATRQLEEAKKFLQAESEGKGNPDIKIETN